MLVLTAFMSHGVSSQPEFQPAPGFAEAPGPLLLTPQGAGDLRATAAGADGGGTYLAALQSAAAAADAVTDGDLVGAADGGLVGGAANDPAASGTPHAAAADLVQPPPPPPSALAPAPAPVVGELASSSGGRRAGDELPGRFILTFAPNASAAAALAG